MSKHSRRKSNNKKGKKGKKGASSKPSRSEPDEPASRRLRSPLPSGVPHISTMRRPDLLQEAIAAHLDLSELDLEVRELPDGSAFGIYLGDRRIGSIAEKYAAIGRHKPLHAFLTPNAPWDRVRAYLVEALEKISTRGPETSMSFIRSKAPAREFPSSAGNAALALAIESTRRIRTERSREYAFVASLAARGGQLIVHPVTPLAGGSVSFELRSDHGTTVRGVLHLAAIGDVLPVTIEGDVTDSALGTSWLAVLSGFADLTCPSPETGEDHQKWLAKALIPTDGPTRVIDSTVAGHRRRLGTKHHGEEAAERAAAIGVELAENETWVKSHTRGAPADSVLEFGWTPATDLQDLLATRDARADAA